VQAERGQSVCEQTAFSEPAVVEEAQPSPGPQQENVSTAAPQSRYVKPEKLEGGEEDTNQQNRSVPHFGSKPLSENRSRARQNFPLAGHTKTHSEEVFYTGDQRANAPLRGLPTNAQSSAEMKMALSLSLWPSVAFAPATSELKKEEREEERKEEKRYVDMRKTISAMRKLAPCRRDRLEQNANVLPGAASCSPNPKA